MTYTAVIRVAPIQTLERRNDPAWTRPGRRLYDSNARRFLPIHTTVPLLVDHDDEREIGYVRESPASRTPPARGFAAVPS